MEPNVEALFPWWAAASADQADATRVRALAWLDHTYASAMLATLAYGDPGTQNHIRSIVKNLLTSESPPLWEDPILMEAWLRGLVEGCAAAVRVDSGQ